MCVRRPSAGLNVDVVTSAQHAHTHIQSNGDCNNFHFEKSKNRSMRNTKTIISADRRGIFNCRSSNVYFYCYGYGNKHTTFTCSIIHVKWSWLFPFFRSSFLSSAAAVAARKHVISLLCASVCAVHVSNNSSCCQDVWLICCSTFTQNSCSS